MSGARIEFTDNVSPALNRVHSALTGSGRQQLFGHFGEYLMRTTRERGAREVSPDGRKWRPLEPAYKRWKQKKRPGVPILKFDFHMLGDQLSYQVDATGLILGTNAPYGARHHFGGTSQHAAHSRKLAFAKNKPNGMKVFAKRSAKPDHEKWATVNTYSVTVAARPWLGLSNDDRGELVQITNDHISAAWNGA